MDYVDRDAAIKLFTFATCDGLGFEPTIHAYEVVDGLKSLPSADVAPVVHAKWEKKDFYTRVCSACGFAIDMGTDSPILIIANYCPSCGAKME